MRRKIEDEGEARRCLSAAKAARLTAGEWAREHGIDGRSLNAWRINLSRPTSEREMQPLRLVVRVGELAVEVDADFDDATLERLVRVLRSC